LLWNPSDPTLLITPQHWLVDGIVLSQAELLDLPAFVARVLLAHDSEERQSENYWKGEI
jgi:hypothetical protein